MNGAQTAANGTTRPLCEPVALPKGLPVRAEHVRLAADAPTGDRFNHFHDLAEIVLFREGRGVFISGDRTHDVRPGSIVHVPPMASHDFALEGGARDWLLIQIAPALACGPGAGFPWPGHLVCAQPPEATATRISLLCEWLLDHPSAAETDSIISLLGQQIATLPVLDPTTGDIPARGAPRLQRALDHLQSHPGSPLSVRDAAALCSLSPAYFSRLFQKSFGRSFSEHVLIHRLHLAARRVASGHDGFAQIAWELGFATPSHFTARFRERFGLTPRAYRETARRR